MVRKVNQKIEETVDISFTYCFYFEFITVIILLLNYSLLVEISCFKNKTFYTFAVIKKIEKVSLLKAYSIIYAGVNKKLDFS